MRLTVQGAGGFVDVAAAVSDNHGHRVPRAVHHFVPAHDLLVRVKPSHAVLMTLIERQELLLVIC